MASSGITSFALALAACSLLTAQQTPRIHQPIDAARIERLPRTTHPLAAAGRDSGRASADLPMERIQMQLKSSPEQQAALDQLVAAQHDPGSPLFQHWLTPEQFGERFGPAQEDIDAVAGWLRDHGFHIDAIGAGRRTLEFSGTAGQVERAFHTQMRHYEVAGERHLANATDIAIPAALAPVIGGVASLHDFRHKPMHQLIDPVPSPLSNLTSGAHGLSPYDFATIYNVTPLWNASFDGAGQSVAIAGRTNLKLSDVASFRNLFGLGANNTQVILNGSDPGILNSGEETEAVLDVEWSGAVAKGAIVKFVVSASTNASDGVDLSNQYIVNNNLAPVMSVSFGACESAMGASGNSFYGALWQQAAAQGISVFISAGDSGSAGCDNPGAHAPATHGLAVSGLASTPYNVAVGGTQFNDTNPAAYWSTSNSSHNSSALDYIPEKVWNESSSTGTINLYAGGGGVSEFYATPTWQTGTGVPAADLAAANQHHRYLPDVALSAAGHDGYLIVREGGLYLAGGTSASSPAFAGLMAIVDQYTGGRNGNPNPRFYSLAKQMPAAFHDVTTGTTAVPCTDGSPGCSAGVMKGYNAGVGYDLATGLGSVDAYALAFNWGARPAAGPSITSLSPNPMTGSAATQTLIIMGSGFAAGATVQAGYPGFSTALTVTSLTATQIQATINPGTTVRNWSITVTNPTGPASFAASLNVVAPATKPVVTSVTPNPLTGSNSGQVITINGTGFQSGTGLKVIVGYAGGTPITLQGSGQAAFVSSTQVLALITVGTTPRTWTVQVVNPSGLVSNAASFQVVGPPTIASLAPNPMPRSGANQTLTINGSGFQPGAALRVILRGGNQTLTLQGAPITSSSATKIQVSVNVGNVARPWSVQVVNPDGTTSIATALTVK